MQNNNKKFPEQLISKTKIYLILIFILLLIISIENKKWIIPAIIIYVIIVSYAILTDKKKKSEISETIQDLKLTVDTAAKTSLINSPFPLVIIEENGKIVELGKWVFGEAAKQCKKWCALQPDFRMSVNLSCRYLEKADMEWFAQATLRRLGLPAKNMILELTESWPVSGSRVNEETVLKLQKTGISLAMDDFGSGYSSLLSLQKFPFQMIKIDKAFVKSK